MKAIGKLILLALICAGGSYAYAHWPEKAPVMVTSVRRPAVPVTAAKVRRQEFRLYHSTVGTVQAYNKVTVRARVDGALEKVLFQEGEDVKAGDVLAVIDPRPFQAALGKAEAMKAKDQAQLSNHKRDLQRYVDLRDYAARQVTDTQRTLVSSTEATLLGDQAAVDAAKVELGYTTIRAPISGRTGARMVDAGNMVKSSEGIGLLTITQVQPIYVSFYLPQDMLDELHEAQKKGDVVVEAYRRDDKVLLASGKLTLIDNQIDPSTGTIHLKATFANADRRLWPGAFVNVHVVTAVDPTAVTVPRQSAQTGTDGRYVFVINSDHTVRVQPIVEGAARDNMLVVKSGLKSGETVVVDGQSKLRDDSVVAIQNEDELQKTASR